MDERRSHEDLGQADDDELLALVRDRRGDQNERSAEAFEILFRRYNGKVYRWCLRVLGDASRAEDVSQGIFLDLWATPRPYRAGQRFGAWLYVLSRNRCLNALRAERRRPDEQWDDRLAEILAASSDPQAELERVEIDDWIREICRERLNEVEQSVVILRYTWGLRVDEITASLGLTNASGARTHLRSAEEKLRRYLQNVRRETTEG